MNTILSLLRFTAGILFLIGGIAMALAILGSPHPLTQFLWTRGMWAVLGGLFLAAGWAVGRAVLARRRARAMADCQWSDEELGDAQQDAEPYVINRINPRAVAIDPPTLPDAIAYTFMAREQGDTEAPPNDPELVAGDRPRLYGPSGPIDRAMAQQLARRQINAAQAEIDRWHHRVEAYAAKVKAYSVGVEAWIASDRQDPPPERPERPAGLSLRPMAKPTAPDFNVVARPGGDFEVEHGIPAEIRQPDTTTRAGRAEAVRRAQHENRARYWTERGENLDPDIVRLGAGVLGERLLLGDGADANTGRRGQMDALLRHMAKFTPLSLPAPTSDAGQAALLAMADTRGEAYRVLQVAAGIAEKAIVENEELRGKLVAGLGMMQAARHAASTSEIDPDVEESIAARFDTLSEADAKQVCIRRGWLERLASGNYVWRHY